MIETTQGAAGTEGATLSVGQRLAAERVRQGLSVGDVARQIRLAVKQVEAIEADDFGSLPGIAFVRGFIRNYAKMLQLDADVLLTNLPSGSLVHPRPLSAPTQHIELSSGARKRWLMYAVIAVVLLALASAAVYGVYEMLRGNSSRAVVKPQSHIQPFVPAPTDPALSLPLPSQSTMPDAAQSSVLPATPPAATQDGLSASATSTASATSGRDGIRMVFIKDAWVEIEDGQGRKIFSQMNAAGTEKIIQGTPPFSLAIGNAAQVRITYNGKPVDLAPHTRVDVARFTLE